jgi:hypothetical protein
MITADDGGRTGEALDMGTIRSKVTGHRLGVAVVLVAAVAVVDGGTAAALALTSGSGPAPVAPMAATPSSTPTSTSIAPPPTTMTPMTTVPTTSGGSVVAPATTPDVSTIISDTCLYSHEANDDPILMPGRTGQSMAHDFYGNTATAASSTAAGLVGGSTTCSTSADASAYWTPVLYQDGVAITPTRNLIYWSGLHDQNPTVTAPPVGLEMIAGNENATTPQSTKVVGWRCADQVPQVVSATPVNCTGTKGVEVRIIFPSCWNGSILNGASQTNVVYPTARTTCPTGYPVRIPTVIFHIVYPITSAVGLTLSMGPGQQGSTATAHGDFISGWNQTVLTRLIDGCASPANTCGHVTGPDALVRPKTA